MKILLNGWPKRVCINKLCNDAASNNHLTLVNSEKYLSCIFEGYSNEVHGSRNSVGPFDPTRTKATPFDKDFKF